MSAGILRRLAGLIGRRLRHVYPGSQSAWARAMHHEVEAIDNDAAALRFALGCFWGGCREAAAERLFSKDQGVSTMTMRFARPGRPANVGIACALAATCLGILYLIAAGAPLRYPVVNAAAFLLGVVALGGVRAAIEQIDRRPGPLLVVLGGSLVLTTLVGASAEGASRWIWIGPLSVQLSLVLLPAMIIFFARRPTLPGSIGIGLAAVALALQPDRAMAGVLAIGLAVLAISRPSRSTLGALAVAIAAFAVAMARPDTLPAVPYVDRILFTAFDIHPLVGAAVLVGALLLLVPSIVGWRNEPAFGHGHVAFGAVWLGCILSAALGNYPTPVVGYGGSAILGYLLSLSCLPASARSVGAGASAAERDDPGRVENLRRSASLA